nr:hypothetical protein [uncultured Draconibacterium sp.]
MRNIIQPGRWQRLIRQGALLNLMDVIAFNYDGIETYVAFDYNGIETYVATNV